MTAPAGRRGRLLGAGLALVLVAGVAATIVLGSRSSGPGEQPGSRPSIVFIITDDQRWDTLGWMPIVERRLARHGVTFSNAFLTNPLCCPSRASILTGQYSHSTGIYRNSPPHGGFPDFKDRSTIATWLRSAGYTTALFGKYLNRYQGTYVPPGWSDWKADSGNDSYYGWTQNVNGRLVNYGTAPSDYQTAVLARQAVSFIERTKGPLFLDFAPTAPHLPTTPAPQDARACPGIGRWNRPPSFNEADVSDKPAWVRALPPLNQDRIRSLAKLRLATCRTLQGVDRAVGQVLDALDRTGRLGRSLIVFMTDNGLAWGEHRWDRKQAAYEESIRTPMIVRYDPLVRAARADPRLVLNVDVAPTAAAVAGVGAPGAEGSSLLAIMRSPAAPWRRDILLEHLRLTRVPSYCGVRTIRYLYVSYETGEQELYDLSVDPYELSNVAGDPAYAAVLRRLRQRDRELCRPPPPGWAGP